MGGVLQVIWLVLDIFIYAPFVIASNELQSDDKEGVVDHHGG
jgi:PTS system cellobiose-specific IIC component